MTPVATCPRCHGTKQEPCPRCAGTMFDVFGEPCGLCQEGRMPCAKCGASGEVPIPRRMHLEEAA